MLSANFLHLPGVGDAQSRETLKLPGEAIPASRCQMNPAALPKHLQAGRRCLREQFASLACAVSDVAGRARRLL